MDATKVVGLDFETYSPVDLKKYGLKNYVSDPNFRVTLAALSFHNMTTHIDFINDSSPLRELKFLLDHASAGTIVAHNSAFEEAVLERIGLHGYTLVDSAVVAASAGASRHLAGAAKQLLSTDKLDGDGKLINLFAVPQKGQRSLIFDRSLTTTHQEKWDEYIEYCRLDAKLCRQLYLTWRGYDPLANIEEKYAELTRKMNRVGWPVDVDLVKAMQRQYEANVSEYLAEFARDVDPKLNLNSSDQLKTFCEERGIRSSSFDKAHVDKLVDKLTAKLQKPQGLTIGESEVLDALRTKQRISQSSLKKLQVILNLEHKGRLYDQYLHVGAPGSHRTTGRGVQMQNLPRLPATPDNVELGLQGFPNYMLSRNIRQVFQASHPDGLLFVADFSSVESRGLALLAGEEWKLQAYMEGRGVYEELAARQFNVAVEQVTPTQRTFGKVGELSCGYQAGPPAVQDFAAAMQVTLSNDEALAVVRDWRNACPNTVKLWADLDAALRTALVSSSAQHVGLHDKLTVTFMPATTPDSLKAMDPKAKSIRMTLYSGSTIVLSRVFHGCHFVGHSIHFYKPSDLKSGDPWKKTFLHPKTKRHAPYTLYGGKLTGILTQSMCREVFFDRLQTLDQVLAGNDNVRIVGQFHDEVIVEWEPGDVSKTALEDALASVMSVSPIRNMPMAVSVKAARRYIK